jgi:hypothetical protein
VFSEHFSGLNLQIQNTPAANRSIEFRKTTAGVPPSNIPGAYGLHVNPDSQAIIISANETTGK